MRRAKFLILIILLICVTTAPVWAAEKTATMPTDAYIIGSGDILDISVWKDEALTRQVAVLPDGKITFPLIGEVVAGGKTVAQLQEDLEKKLLRYVPELELSLLVNQVNSMMIYVIGRVNNPGRFVIYSDVNALQALAMAGGLNPFAKRGSIRIFRETGDGTKIFSFDYDDVSKGEDLEQNIRLKRGDVIVVP